jgi:hypothetical protein
MIINRRVMALLGSVILIAVAQPQDARWHLGTRATILTADAPPANDMTGIGLLVRRSWRPGWYWGAALDLYGFDYEEPYKVIGIEPDPTVVPLDGDNDSTVLSAWIEREYGHSSSAWRWFWTAGIGYASIEADAVAGPTATGGTFDIRTEAEDEIHFLASGGLRYSFGGRWWLESALHAQHHMLDYDLTDVVSGTQGNLSGQTPVGISIGFGARF